MTSTESTFIHTENRPDGIVVLTLDDPVQRANTLRADLQAALHEAIEDLVARREEITGVVLTSAKKTFVAGADLGEVQEAQRTDVDALTDAFDAFKRDLRTLEKLGRPVVAALNGSALGGGYELALACHHRIAVDDDSIRIGLPEVGLGLLPAGGGVSRLVRKIGLMKAVPEYLLQGRTVRPSRALADGLVDELVETKDDLVPAAVRWIEANPEVVAPWDVKGFRIPGGGPTSPGVAAVLPSVPANLAKQTGGANLPAPHAILACAVEGAQVDIDTSMMIETRYVKRLLADRVSANMIQAFFFDMQHCRAGGARPTQPDGSAYPERRPTKVAVVGAGMMGAGIAYVTAKAGIDVVLKDVELAAAQKGKACSEKLVGAAVAKGRTTEEDAAALLGRITPTAEVADLAGCDLVVEAVFESPELKATVLQELEGVVAPDALIGSNTSSLPITGLAQAVQRPADMIGLHFFSPVDKMPLLEIILGEQTSDAALARSLDYAKAIGMTPIVVGDSRGFYTSRVFARYVTEAAQMLAEGVLPSVIEHAGRKAGYPAAPLQLLDELNLVTIQKIMAESVKADDSSMRPPAQAVAVIDRMIDAGRSGRHAGAGFYEYVDGRRSRLWPELTSMFGSAPAPGVYDPAPELDDLVDRFLLLQALEAQRCVDEGVVKSDAEANVGAILGIGFPAWTGGPRQFLATYPGGREAFVARARELEAAHGARFRVPESLES